MRFLNVTRRGALGTIAVLIASGVAFRCGAGTLEVKVTDDAGNPLAQVAVYATPVGGTPAARPKAEQRTAVMDQRDNQFVPHILVISAGTKVQFPNNDVVSHHVYSFSPAKRFELPLYKGNQYEPAEFAVPGIVVLGCNIHDSMLAYVIVVPTEHYALSDKAGTARLEGVPPGAYRVEAVTPRSRPLSQPAERSATVTDGVTQVDLRVTGRLAPEHDAKHRANGLSWDRY